LIWTLGAGHAAGGPPSGGLTAARYAEKGGNMDDESVKVVRLGIFVLLAMGLCTMVVCGAVYFYPQLGGG
jgi:hypothetical protein